MFEELLQGVGEWLKGRGPDSDIVISTRIRIARNLDIFPFPNRISTSEADKLFRNLQEAAGKSKMLKQLKFFRMEDIEPLDREFLVERHLISQEHALRPKNKAVMLSEDEIISIMVNEEDHLRIQVIKSGFDFVTGYRLASKVEDEVARKVKFAFHSDIGFLTACPTNVGTGLRVSAMVHLPALIITKRINKILEFVSKLSFAARGFLGEGTQAIGNFFQISNQVTLGLGEEEIIDNLSSVIRQLRRQEIEARRYMMTKFRYSLEDRIWRALGTLKTARIISSQETLQHLSLLRLGMDLGIIKGLSKELLNNIYISIQPAHLQKLQERKLSHTERDIIRGDLLREKLGGISV